MALRLPLTLLSVFISLHVAFAQNSESIPNFTLKDVISGKNIAFHSYKSSKAVVVIFTSNYCPYAKLYEQRIAELHREYTTKGVSFMLINSNNSSLSNDESIVKMILKAKEKKYEMPYFADKQLQAKEIFGAEKTPETFVVRPDQGALRIVYRGAIDDNPQSPDEVEENYVKSILDKILANEPTPYASKRPTGCRIKTN